MLNVTLPIYYTQEFKTKKSKTFLVNLNWYRNAHHFIQNEVKKHYHELVFNQLRNASPIEGPYKLRTELYYKNPSCDGRNIVPMIEKFLLDAIQDLNLTPNDNIKFDKGGTWVVAGQDKLNPRLEVFILDPNLN